MICLFSRRAPTESGKTEIVIYCLTFIFLFLTTPVYGKDITPREDYCRIINDPNAGHDFLLMPGRYQGSCKIRRGGTSERPLMIRPADPANPPILEYPGSTTNVIEIHADYISIRGLQFFRTKPGVDAIRIITGNHISIENCAFLYLRGLAIAATHTTVKGLTVRRNLVTNSHTTAMYFGCHNGSDCTVSNLIVEDNEIRSVTASGSETGYGIQIKLNSTAVIRSNRVSDTLGPGIMVYGSQSSEMSVVEGNWVEGSRKDSGILIGGGPVLVRNNISVHNARGGIGLQDYANRGLLRKIAVIHNTLYGNGRGGIFISGDRLADVQIANNAGVLGPALSVPSALSPGVQWAANIDCTIKKCFKDPQQQDFSPGPGSPLLGSGVYIQEWMPTEDFFTRKRGAPPTVGAVEFESERDHFPH